MPNNPPRPVTVPELVAMWREQAALYRQMPPLAVPPSASDVAEMCARGLELLFADRAAPSRPVAPPPTRLETKWGLLKDAYDEFWPKEKFYALAIVVQILLYGDRELTPAEMKRGLELAEQYGLQATPSAAESQKEPSKQRKIPTHPYYHNVPLDDIPYEEGGDD